MPEKKLQGLKHLQLWGPNELEGVNGNIEKISI